MSDAVQSPCAEPRSPRVPRARFETLLEPVLAVGYGVALRLSGNADDAQDLVQEAALLALRGYHSFEPGTNFKAWYLRILTNCFFARCRKKRREPVTVDLEEVPPCYLMTRVAAAGLHDRFDDPAAAMLGRMDAEQVAAAIATLPEEFRIVTALYFIDDLTYSEIADVLDCPLGTVRSRLHRGRRLLQQALWHLAVETGIVSALAANTRGPGAARSAGMSPRP
jgi:RNA polymerase sigma-70 factor, ECF subfamily